MSDKPSDLTIDLKYIHGALFIAQSRAEGAELQIIRNAIRMVEKIRKKVVIR